ncbi:hypothetical protein Tco_0720563 [Tanacetum coccineum]
MTLDIHNWLSIAHQELHKIIKYEIFHIVNQVVARVQNFKIQFLKEAAKFVQDFKSLAKEADESLAMHKALEYEIERLLRAIFNQDIMSIVQSNSVIDTSNLHTELECTKERMDLEANLVVEGEDIVSANGIRVLMAGWLGKGRWRWEGLKGWGDVGGGGCAKLECTGVDNISKTKRPQPRSNTKNNRVPSASKSYCIKTKYVEVEEHHRNLLLSKNKKHMSSGCNNIKLAIRNDKSKVVCAMCKQCLITSNHDVCVLNYVNDINSRVNHFNANVSNTTNKKKHKPKVKKPKLIRSKERLASPKPNKPRSCLMWSPT